MKFVSMWGNAISVADRRPENYAKDLTLRYPVHCMFSGNKIRITLDNFCGTEDVKISEVYIAATDDDSRNIKGKSIAVTFGGNKSVVISKGERVKSDEIEFDVIKGNDISVSIYFGEFTLMRSAVLITGPLSKGYYSAGYYPTEQELPLDYTRNTNWFYFLSDIEVYTDESNKALICFGDSITSQAWPDYLNLRLEKEGINNRAIVRKAASGTRVLRQYDNITYDSYGIKGDVRFPREAIVEGADAVLIQHGINDIIHPVGVEVNPFRPWSDLPTADEIIDGYKNYISIARSYGLKVYMGTLLPIYGWRTYAEFRDELRVKVNDWIRTTDMIDGYVDFDLVIQNPDFPKSFGENMDSGDHLHPSDMAYQKMADAIPAEWLV